MNGVNFHGNHIKVKEQRKKEENEILNSNNNLNYNNLGSINLNSFNNNIQSYKNPISGNLSLLENINSLNFYPKKKNIDNLNSNINNNDINNDYNKFLNNQIEIFEKLDEFNLYKKIKQAIEKMKEHYYNNFMGDKSKLKSKYYF
jgi:hypothetical protein